MIRKEIKFSPSQLDELLKAIVSKKESFWSPKNILLLGQFCAILFCGLWALFQYQYFHKESQSLSLQNERLKYELAEVQFKKSTDARYHAEFNCDVQHLRDIGDQADYQITVNFSLTNTSDSDFSVIYSVVELFEANPVELLTTESSAATIEYPPPPYISDNSYIPGNKEGQMWKKKASKVHAETNNPILKLIEQAGYKNINFDGGGVHKLKPGETASSGCYFILRAKPDSWIGIVVQLGFDDDDERFRFWREIKPLQAISK